MPEQIDTAFHFIPQTVKTAWNNLEIGKLNNINLETFHNYLYA